MADDSKRVDAYIQNAPEFARPILEKIRIGFHKGCPTVEEAIKWGCPYFMYKGMLGGMAAFKGHVGFGFWNSKLLDDPEKLFETGTGPKASMCNVHLKAVKDLPEQSVLVDYVKSAAKLDETGIKKDAAKSTATTRISTRVPPELMSLLKSNSKAKVAFEALAASHKREYIEWITDAKREITRQKRLATTIEWLNEGKRRNWKYESKK